MKMYNFLDYKLKPSVCASCPETDGFEVENLVSENEFTKSKGFIAYSAIRPPINVDFGFICPININYILLWTSNGTQKSIGVEVLAKNSNSDYTTICRTQTEAPGIVFYNKKHLQKKHENIPQDFFELHCRSLNYSLLSSVEKVRVRIFRTVNSVPCIGKIEIWGEISRVCSATTKQTIQHLLTRNNKNLAAEINLPSSSDQNKTVELFNIPEDFVDPISCEIMCLPMTLPCGKTVDQSTLEKHQESEARWGRSPSDPFTGQVFTSLRKPVLNSALKSRIDIFLLQNAHNKNTFNIQRTLGRKIVRENKESNNTIYNNQVTLEEQTNTETNEHQVPQLSDVSENLSDLISRSIEKYNITRFSKMNESPTINKNMCGWCKSDINLYKLTCMHIICRICLFKLTETRCKICNVVFTKSNVKKFHN